MTAKSEIGRGIPVFTLTGFLGAGKTTLINRLLSNPALGDTVVIVNEFGDIGLDHLLVEKARDGIVLLDSGCLCCTVLDSLRETLGDLYQRRAAGKIPPFSRILIETSGLADPAPILATLHDDPLLAGLFRRATLSCVVDAVNAQSTLRDLPEASEQVVLADCLIVTKTDLTGGIPPSLSAELRAINPLARTVDALHGDAQLEILDERIATGQRPAEGAQHSHRHDIGITAISLERRSPSTFAGIAAWTGHLKARYDDRLLRVKALLAVSDGSATMVVQGVRKDYRITRSTVVIDDDEPGLIVLIGRALDPAEIHAGLAWLDLPAGVSAPVSPDFP